jgi:hypothetical protein
MKPYPDDDDQDDFPEEPLFLEDEVIDEADSINEFSFLEDENYEEPEFYIDHLGILICSDDDPLSDASALDDDLIDDSDFSDSNFEDCGFYDTDIGGDCDLRD